MRHEEYSPADMALLEHLFQEAAHIEPSEKIKRIEFMKGGGEEDLIVLALPMFPNLTLIEFRASNDHVLPRLFEFTQFIAAERAQTSTGNTPLSSLTRINIGVSTRGTSPGWVDILTVQAFAILPSVRVINADCLYGSMNDLKSDIPPFLHSNVTDLKFSRADLPPDRVMLLLEGFDSLQSFAYWSARNSSRPSLFSPFLIIKGLLASSQQTLRELYLRAGNEDWDYMGSLCRFTALESLETDLLLLLGPLPRTKVTFETSLPPSIRILKLYGGPSLMYTRDMQCQNLLNGLPNLKIRFSKLSNIALLGFKIPEIRAQDMARRCGDVGTTLVVMHRGLNVYPIFDRHQGHRIEYSPHDDKVVHEYLD